MNEEEELVTRRRALERGAGLAATGAASVLAPTLSNSSAAAAADSASASHQRVADPRDNPLPRDNMPPSERDNPLPSEVAGIPLPGSEVARRAAALARQVSNEPLFHHVMRTYLFSSLLFDRRGVRYDRELVFVAAMLHDLGLVAAYRTPDERFELDGADAARRFLREQRMPAERVEIVWDAIALHTNSGIATRKRPEIAMIAVGSGIDFAGHGLDQIPPDTLGEILEAFPRKGFKQDALDNILSLCRTKPTSVLMHPFAEVGRRHLPDFPVPTVEDLLLAAPFEE